MRGGVTVTMITERITGRQRGSGAQAATLGRWRSSMDCHRIRALEDRGEGGRGLCRSERPTQCNEGQDTGKMRGGFWVCGRWGIQTGSLLPARSEGHIGAEGLDTSNGLV